MNNTFLIFVNKKLSLSIFSNGSEQRLAVFTVVMVFGVKLFVIIPVGPVLCLSAIFAFVIDNWFALVPIDIFLGIPSQHDV